MMRVAVAMAPEVRQLLQEDPEQLRELLEEIHEEDLADLLGLLDDAEAAQVLKSLKAEDAAPVFERLDEETQEALVEEMGRRFAAGDRDGAFALLHESLEDINGQPKCPCRYITPQKPPVQADPQETRLPYGGAR